MKRTQSHLELHYLDLRQLSAKEDLKLPKQTVNLPVPMALTSDTKDALIQTNFPSLPREIRDQIYEDILIRPHPILVGYDDIYRGHGQELCNRHLSFLNIHQIPTTLKAASSPNLADS
ncbi:hypothetical protein MMC28_011197 [Mycoblastus sanguinarius]|nr:hypothetical protein [Mycoblastus sanguinarius]